MDAETKYITLHETVLSSWLKDFGSLGSLAGLIYVNHTYGAGNGAVDAVGAVLLLGFIISRAIYSSKTAIRFTREEFRQWAISDNR